MKKINYFMFLLIIFFLYPVPDNIFSLNQRNRRLQDHLDKTQSIDTADVSFGFADSSGRFLLASKINSSSKNSYYAVMSSGKIFKLDFIEERGEEKESTGRQTAGNFNNSGGFLFKSPYIKLGSSKTYLIADSNYLAQHVRLSIEPVSYLPLASNNINRIKDIKEKKIKSSWQIGKTDSDIILALILFQPDRDTALASLTLMKDDLLISEDYPGNLKDEYSVWRTDDEGVFNPESINVLALFYSEDGFEIARTWAGEEGENSVFLLQEGDIFKPVIEYYRYWAAE